jgi:hypothetical protein
MKTLRTLLVPILVTLALVVITLLMFGPVYSSTLT